jgi:two-component system, LuxR family, response regulator FixJ
MVMAPAHWVYIVDDDDAVRHSLSTLFEVEGYRTRSFPSASAFLDAAPALAPGCLISDVQMPGIGGLELRERLNATGRDFPMIVITGHGDVPLAVRAMKAGAVDFVEKPFAPAAILDSLAAAFARLRPAVPESPGGTDAAARLALLSPREREVLAGLLAGLPNKSIAYDLAISPRTVEIHRARVMDKMGARSLSELIRLALAAGMQPEIR